MKRLEMTIPEIGLVAITRAAAGMGLGLLLAERMEKKERRLLGGTLLVAGALSTIPILAHILRKRCADQCAEAT